MAVRTGMDELTNLNAGADNGTARSNGNRTRGRNDDRAPITSVGLSGMDDILISGYSDGEIVSKFLEGAKKGLKTVKNDIRVLKLDKEKYELEFTTVVFATETEKGVYYYSALLEATGRSPLEVRDVVDSLNVKNSNDILVTSDGFDDDFYDIATKALKQLFKVEDETKLHALEGVVISNGAEPEITGEYVAKFAHDILIVNALTDDGKATDAKIEDINKMLRNGTLGLDVAFASDPATNAIGRTVRSDFALEVSIIRNGNVRSFNGQNGRRKIATSSGYLEYLVKEEVSRYTREIHRVAEPMIILNEFIGAAPSLNYTLLSIINATAFTNGSMLRNLVVEQDAGPLNFMFNYNGEGGKYGEKLSFKSPDADPETINDIIRQHISPAPIFAIEVEEFGAEYSYLSAFASLADRDTKNDANDDICEAVSELVSTSKTGPIDFNMSVVSSEPIYIPLGEYEDNNGDTRDIRDIDTAFITNHTNDVRLVMDWLYSNAPSHICYEATGKDNYIVKLEVIDKLASILNIRPRITGRAVRLVLDAEFVTELTELALDAGYAPNNETPNISRGDYNNLQAMANAYESSAVGNTGIGVSRSGRGNRDRVVGAHYRYRR